MANFTKQAIRTSFMKLLNEKPLGKISVRDIVEDCGINRNSFYYHYQDIPALISEITFRPPHCGISRRNITCRLLQCRR